MHSNLTEDRPTFVTHLECAMTGETHQADVLQGLSLGAGKPLLVRYDLDGVSGALTKQALAQRSSGGARLRSSFFVSDSSLGVRRRPGYGAVGVAELDLAHVGVATIDRGHEFSVRVRQDQHRRPGVSHFEAGNRRGVRGEEREVG